MSSNNPIQPKKKMSLGKKVLIGVVVLILLGFIGIVFSRGEHLRKRTEVEKDLKPLK